MDRAHFVEDILARWRQGVEQVSATPAANGNARKLRAQSFPSSKRKRALHNRIMLLTITTTHAPATDLGYLLHKSPYRVQSFPLPFGQAHVFYPEASHDRCTAALLLDVDPVGLVRNRRGPSGAGRTLEQYVSDRPYVASSFLSVALARVFGSAMSGKSKDHQELAETALPLRAKISVLPCRGGEG